MRHGSIIPIIAIVLGIIGLVGVGFMFYYTAK
jgi:hypothetical protein